MKDWSMSLTKHVIDKKTMVGNRDQGITVNATQDLHLATKLFTLSHQKVTYLSLNVQLHGFH